MPPPGRCGRQARSGARAPAATALNGISTTQGVPNLAGQRAGLSVPRVAGLSVGRPRRQHHEQRRQVPERRRAGQGGGVLCQPRSGATGRARRQPAPAKADPVQAGKAAAAGCAGCHGETGVSKMPGMPSLVGLDPKYLVAAMKAYKSGQRKNDMMKSMLAAVADADLEQHRAVLRAAKARAGADPGRRATRRRARRPPPPAPAATATRASAAIPRRRASPARTRSISPPRCTATRTARAATRR